MRIRFSHCYYLGYWWPGNTSIQSIYFSAVIAFADVCDEQIHAIQIKKRNPNIKSGPES